MNKIHIIYIPFTGVGKVGYKGDEWFKDRIEIFKNYTLKSLLNQSNQQFLLWISFREEESENPLLFEFKKLLDNSLDGRYLLTFNGLMYFDDRNEVSNENLQSRLFYSLVQMSAIKDSDLDYIYLTRIDSDDMFHKDVVQLIQDQETFEGALTLQLGYVYNKDTGEVCEWNPLTNPPFHTIMMKRETFFDPDKHIEAYKGFKSHEDIARLPHKLLWRGDNRRDRLYCVLTHNPEMHISTTWNHEFRGKAVDPSILKEFGI